MPSLVKIDMVVLEKKIFKWPHPIFIFLWLSPLVRDLAFYLNKLEFLSPKDNVYQVWLNLACWFSRRFLKIFSVFLLFCYYLPLEKGNPLHLNKLESPSLKDDLCQVWLKLAQWFWRRSQKCKSLQRDRRTDDGQKRSEQLTWGFSSGELKIWNCYLIPISMLPFNLFWQGRKRFY
jgi:hypothetical protein